MNLLRARIILILLLCFTGISCTNSETRTFAGFTFGGGGNTFDAEPAKMTKDTQKSVLEAGLSSDKVYLKLTWTSEEALGQSIELSDALITVPGVSGQNVLKDGHIVIQAVDGSIVHGSFDLTAKTEDGREQMVVGSFTASQ